MATKSSEEREHLIFVSYAHEDQSWIKDLDLDKTPEAVEPATFWIDHQGIHPGDRWNEKAKQALQRATAVVLLFSNSFFNSKAIEEEELPIIRDRYHKGEIVLVFVPIGSDLDKEKMTEGLNLKEGEIDKLISIPAWGTPLTFESKGSKDIRDKIVSAVTEPPEVQNLRVSLHPNYRLKSSLGRPGPLGRVFTAHDTQLNRVVAIKLLRNPVCDKHFKESICKVEKATDHTNILSVYAAYLNVVPPHYVRQYIPGQTLSARLNENNPEGKLLPIKDVRRALEAIGEAVNHAHEKGISNLNIKPSNVIISDETGEYFLSLNSYAELDLPQNEEWHTKDKEVLYVPPEYHGSSVVRNDSSAPLADQYRLGLVAYEMLVGSARFEELGTKLRQPDFDPNTWNWEEIFKERKGCPLYLCHLVDRMIKANPEARYGSLDEALGGLHRDDAVEMVRESYRRLVKSKGGGQSDFFRSFYVKFLEQYPGIEDFFNPKEKFGKLTSDGPVSQGWQRQFQVLKEAVLLLIVFHAFNESQQEPNILTRILDAHTDRKIPGGLYAAFGEVLIDSVIDKDVDAHMPKSELRRAWEQVIKDGLDYMENKTLVKERAKYAKPPPIIMKV